MGLTLAGLATETGIPVWLMVLAIVWTLSWKAVACWKSAQRKHIIWFIAFFITNTLGILEIIYIFLFSKLKLSRGSQRKPRKKRR